MEGDDFPYFFDPASSSFHEFPNSLNDLTSSNNALGQQYSMQSPQFDHSSDQVDLASFLQCDGSMEEHGTNSAMVSSYMEESGNVNNNIDNINYNKTKNKPKFCRKKKCIPPRVAFHTRSEEDILDDGYKWRKYGQKSVKNSIHPRSYYRCTHHTCNVKKQIQRLSKDTAVLMTTYEGVHNHPCEKLMETLTPLLRQLQFLSRF